MDKFIKLKTNIIWQGIYQAVILILGFVVPYVVLNTYGSEVNGLTSTIKQIILLSSLASAGITTAATYSLYKAVQEEDKSSIAGTLIAVKKAYRIITFITAVVCVFSSIFLAFFQKGSLNAGLVFVACFLTSLNTLIDLYYTATTSVFLTATQDKHIISIGLLLAGIVMYGGQIIICLLHVHYIWLYSTSVIGTLAKVFFLHFFFKNRYTRYKLSDHETPSSGSFSMRSVGFAFANEVAHTVNVATQSIIVSTLYGLSEASVLSIYMMVVNALSLIAQVVYTSFAPSFGAVVAEGNKQKINDVFEIFQYTIFFINAFLYMCAVPLFIPFVKLYTLNVTDISYTSELMMIESVLYGVFYAARVPYNIVVSTNGIFKKSAIQTSLTCIATVGLSVFLTSIDYRFVLIGSILFYMINTFYQHFMLVKEIQGFENKHFYRHFAVTACGIGTMYLISRILNFNKMINEVTTWMVFAVIVSVFSFAVLTLLSWLIDKDSLKKTCFYLKVKMQRNTRN